MTPAEADFKEARFYHLSLTSRNLQSGKQGNRMNAMRLPVKGEEGRVRLACFFGLRLAKTLFVSAASLPRDGFERCSSVGVVLRTRCSRQSKKSMTDWKPATVMFLFDLTTCLERRSGPT